MAKKVPSCAAIQEKKNGKRTYCLEDYEYPKHEIEKALHIHYPSVIPLYKDTQLFSNNSIESYADRKNESWLCPVDIHYEKPLRAVNNVGDWKIIVNGVKVHYNTLTQSVRLEMCKTSGEKCPFVPEREDTTCLQKMSYQRLLVYEPYEYMPFKLDSFKLPVACACRVASNFFDDGTGANQGGISEGLSFPVLNPDPSPANPAAAPLQPSAPGGDQFSSGNVGPSGYAQRKAQTPTGAFAPVDDLPPPPRPQTTTIPPIPDLPDYVNLEDISAEPTAAGFADAGFQVNEDYDPANYEYDDYFIF